MRALPSPTVPIGLVDEGVGRSGCNFAINSELFGDRTYDLSMLDDITEFVGVYDADSTVIGEVSYWIGARLGMRHCALCDITHGLFTKRADWQECQDRLPIPFHTFHRNDAPEDVLRHAVGQFPCVIARHGPTFVTVLTPGDLESMEGSSTALSESLHEYLEEVSRGAQ